MAEGLIDTGTNLTHQIEKGIIAAVGAAVVFKVLQEFVRGGMVAGILALVLGGIVYWGAGHMDVFKDKTGETVNNTGLSQLADEDRAVLSYDPHTVIQLSQLVPPPGTGVHVSTSPTAVEDA